MARHGAPGLNVSLAARALTAATRPLHLAPLGVGVVVGGGLVAVGLAPLAVVVGGLSVTTWGALVGWDLLAGAGAERPVTPTPATPPPDRRTVRSLVLRKALQDVDQAAARVLGRMRRQDGVLGAAFVELEADVRGLVEQAEGLAAQGDGVFAFLLEHDPATLERELHARSLAARQAADPEAARSLQSAAESKRRQLEAWKELRTLGDRVTAELAALQAALEELDVRVVKLTLQDPAGAARVGADAGRDIRALRERVGVLEQAAARTLRELG